MSSAPQRTSGERLLPEPARMHYLHVNPEQAKQKHSLASCVRCASHASWCETEAGCEVPLICSSSHLENAASTAPEWRSSLPCTTHRSTRSAKRALSACADLSIGSLAALCNAPGLSQTLFCSRERRSSRFALHALRSRSPFAEQRSCHILDRQPVPFLFPFFSPCCMAFHMKPLPTGWGYSETTLV